MNDQHRIEIAADNCEVLRARLAKYEDADGKPKAQPSGVVQWPDADEIMQMAFEEGQPGDDASGYYFELEEFDLFIQRLMEEVARLNSSPVSAGVVGERAAQCDHQWIDDGQFLLVCTSCGAQEDHDPHWRDMATAPRDGTMVRLLVEFTEHETEDADQAPTIGANNFDNDGEDRWQFAGWCWSHNHFVEGKGEPVGWLPMIEARAALSTPSHGEQVRDNRAEFKREERYMVVKLSKLADDLSGDELSREEQIYQLAHFGKALVECVVVESDWPEYEPTWAAIKARVTGSIASNQLPGGWAAKPTDDGEGFIISSPRVNGVASHFSVFPDSKDYASCALWKMLAAAPSAGSQEKGE